MAQQRKALPAARGIAFHGAMSQMVFGVIERARSRLVDVALVRFFGTTGVSEVW